MWQAHQSKFLLLARYIPNMALLHFVLLAVVGLAGARDVGFSSGVSQVSTSVFSGDFARWSAYAPVTEGGEISQENGAWEFLVSTSGSTAIQTLSGTLTNLTLPAADPVQAGYSPLGDVIYLCYSGTGAPRYVDTTTSDSGTLSVPTGNSGCLGISVASEGALLYMLGDDAHLYRYAAEDTTGMPDGAPTQLTSTAVARFSRDGVKSVVSITEHTVLLGNTSSKTMTYFALDGAVLGYDLELTGAPRSSTNVDDQQACVFVGEDYVPAVMQCYFMYEYPAATNGAAAVVASVGMVVMAVLTGIGIVF